MSHDLAVTSLLEKKFGKNTLNFFAGAELNRYSFLRTKVDFLSKSLLKSDTKFLAYKDLKPLFSKDGTALRFVKWQDLDIRNPFQGGKEDSKISDPTLVFLGVDEKNSGSGTKDTIEQALIGTSYWAVDVSKIAKSFESDDTEHQELRFLVMKLPHTQAAIAGHGRALIDWNVRNSHCPGCGKKTIQVWAGHKRTCPPEQVEETDSNGEKNTCVSRKGLHNYQYPRTDPVIIMAVLSPDASHLLLGRQKHWPTGFYSCTAGFCEPGETLEEAVRREVYEETGVRVGHVQYHSSQPWPFPNSLMCGFFASALPDSGQNMTQSTVRLDLDEELEDAQWYSRAQLKEALERSDMTRQDAEQLERASRGEGTIAPESKGPLKMPPKTAIAHQLVRSFVEDEWGLEKMRKAQADASETPRM